METDTESPDLRTISSGGLDLAVWEWPGQNPPLVFAHATGFHGRAWDHIARLFPGRRRLALDFRGHGRSGKPEPPVPWRSFGRDAIAVAEHWDVRDAIGIGHSMGGHALVQALAARPRTFAAVLLVDPVIFPPEYYRAGAPDASFILRRRARWHSPAEMLESFRKRPPFQSWRPEALESYCAFALLPHDGGFRLACPPEIEASIYHGSNAPEANLYAEIPTIPQPVTVLRAGLAARAGVFDLSASPTAPDLASKFPRGRDVLLPDNNHFIPMERPELVADEIRRFLLGT
ncbi:MAG: alpha/beta hydrolase [Acidobacteriia bacterium]|nr:alpha/beta hydrolase [Terriglobia bacterium]